MDGRTDVLRWFSSESSEMPKPDTDRRTSQEERRALPRSPLHPPTPRPVTEVT